MNRDDDRRSAPHGPRAENGPKPMRCRQVKEEFVLVFGRQEPGRRLTVAIRQQVADCPECIQLTAKTRRIVTIVRERCVRRQAPGDLRERIIGHLRDG